MSQLVDLHMHTLHSDGILSVKDLINLAKTRGVEIMSINDHDTVKGVMEMKTLEVSGIIVLCGIELSNSFNGCGTIHITGYFPPTADFEALQAILEERVSQKRSRLYWINHTSYPESEEDGGAAQWGWYSDHLGGFDESLQELSSLSSSHRRGPRSEWLRQDGGGGIRSLPHQQLEIVRVDAFIDL